MYRPIFCRKHRSIAFVVCRSSERSPSLVQYVSYTIEKAYRTTSLCMRLGGIKSIIERPIGDKALKFGNRAGALTTLFRHCGMTRVRCVDGARRYGVVCRTREPPRCREGVNEPHPLDRWTAGRQNRTRSLWSQSDIYFNNLECGYYYLPIYQKHVLCFHQKLQSI